jgi:transketolase
MVATPHVPGALPLEALKAKSLNLRRNMFVQAAGKGQGYLGQGFAIADMLAALYFHELRYDPSDPDWEERDRFYLSTGHYSIALWAVLAKRATFPRTSCRAMGQMEAPRDVDHERRCPEEMTGGSLGSLGSRSARRCYRSMHIRAASFRCCPTASCRKDPPGAAPPIDVRP